MMLTEFQIDEESAIPKYRQIVSIIMDNIEKGILKIGHKVPSINEISERLYLSRDTVEKAYNSLKEKGIIISVHGKGFYVASNVIASRKNILFLLNKLSSYKLQIYNSFVNSLGHQGDVNLKIYHCDPKLFLSILEENKGVFDYYVIMPHFKNELRGHENSNYDIISALKLIPEDKLILLDNNLPELSEKIASVYQDFKMDIFDALSEALSILSQYSKLILIFPRNPIYPYPLEILQGFKEFCAYYHFDSLVLNSFSEENPIIEKEAYIIIEETDLVNLVQKVRNQNLQLGKDIGVISYNETPLKSLLGITVFSTDFCAMGETAAYMIMKNKKDKVKNVFKFVNRNSI